MLAPLEKPCLCPVLFEDGRQPVFSSCLHGRSWGYLRGPVLLCTPLQRTSAPRNLIVSVLASWVSPCSSRAMTELAICGQSTETSCLEALPA